MFTQYFKEIPTLIAGISDHSISFMPTDFDAPLTPHQREYLKQQTGWDIPQVFWRKQVHGDTILVAVNNARDCQGQKDADAYITQEKHLPIAIRTADCVPVFLYDPKQQAIGLVHAGWQGTVVAITQKTVIKMRDHFGCDPANILAVIGPCALPCCYHVGEEFKQYFPDCLEVREGKLYADVALANKKQLLAAGLTAGHIHQDKRCTICNQNFFSFRRQSDQSGRMISVMMMV